MGILSGEDFWSEGIITRKLGAHLEGAQRSSGPGSPSRRLRWGTGVGTWLHGPRVAHYTAWAGPGLLRTIPSSVLGKKKLIFSSLMS